MNSGTARFDFFLTCFLFFTLALFSPGSIQAKECGSCLTCENASPDCEGSAKVNAGAKWYVNFEEAKAAAKKENKVIFMDFSGSDWCGWCIRLDNEVLEQKAFVDYARDNLVLLKLDFPRNLPLSPEQKEHNKALLQKYGVRGFPTIILLNANADFMAQIGYQQGGAENYVKFVKETIKKNSK